MKRKTETAIVNANQSLSAVPENQASKKDSIYDFGYRNQYDSDITMVGE